MAPYERSGRLCLGNDLGHGHMAISWFVDRRAPGTSWPYGHAEPSFRINWFRDVKSGADWRRGTGASRTSPRHQPVYLTEFRLENHLPLWRYELDGIILEKRALLLLNGQNTVHINYKLVSDSGGGMSRFTSLNAFSPHEEPGR